MDKNGPSGFTCSCCVIAMCGSGRCTHGTSDEPSDVRPPSCDAPCVSARLQSQGQRHTGGGGGTVIRWYLLASVRVHSGSAYGHIRSSLVSLRGHSAEIQEDRSGVK